MVAGLVAGACGGSDSGDATATTAAPSTTAVATTTSAAAPTTAPTTTVPAPTTTALALPLPAPAGDAFYTPPQPLPAGRPGDVIWAREVKAPQGARSWLVLYLSRDVHGDPVAVSGTVTAPATPASDRPIVAWGHGTTGVGDQCASSKSFETGTSAEALLASVVTGQGRVFAATDYEGLGTPGVHTYLVGVSEGQAVLDSIRAAQRLAGTGAGPASKAVVWGHSQGGQAAGMAADLAPTYAPDANVVGALVGSPAAELPTLFGRAGSQAVGYGFLVGAGFHAAYPDLDLGAVFTPAGQQAVEQASTACVGDITSAFQGKDQAEYLVADGVTDPAWVERLRQNSPGQVATPVPVFVYQGEADELIPVEVSKLLLDRYCSVGTTAYRKTYPRGTHAGVVVDALGDISAYVADRLAGVPAPSSC